MRDAEESLIWRCIRPKKSPSKYWEVTLSVVRTPREDAEVGPLRILYEQRPYEFGWLLFALAGKPGAEGRLKGV